MFTSFLGSNKFTSKCKNAAKCVNSRVEHIGRKKKAMLRFLRKDVADLLSNGLDSVAFGRIDALIAEINHASCYDMIELYCGCILKWLPCMQKMSECPKYVEEAAATLIFAAARFPDLPELSDLRAAFGDRYGTHMASFVNDEFMEKLQEKSFSVDKKLQLMQEIAEEFSIRWDFKTFQQNSRHHSPPACLQHQEMKATLPCNGTNGLSRTGNAAAIGAKATALRRGSETTPRATVRKQETKPEGEFKMRSKELQLNHTFPSQERKLMGIYGEAPEYDSFDESLCSRISSTARDFGHVKHTVSSKAAAYAIPPYTKSKGTRTEATHFGDSHDGGLANVEFSRHGDGLDQERNKPKSVRTKLPPRAVDEFVRKVEEEDEFPMQTPSGNGRHGTRLGAGEKEMDKLLLHYSRKGAPPADGSKTRMTKPPGDHVANDGGSLKGRPADSRASSLRWEPAAGLAQATLRTGSQRVSLVCDDARPQLLNDDELAARFMALKKG